LRFTTRDGVTYLAVGLFQNGETVILKCPWTYTAVQGGGSIVQRFGTPHHFTEAMYNGTEPFGVLADSPVRWFGVKDTGDGDFHLGMHNIWYTRSSETAALRGRETLTIFINQQEEGHSSVYEFAFRPVVEGSADDTGDDAVFDTDYVVARLPFTSSNCGGARVLGDGVYLVAGGAASNLTVVDLHNNTQTHVYTQGGAPSFPILYDPFIRYVPSREVAGAH
jgi:hypothetical protein